jgi:ABC-type transporter Mla subunit MlaD
VTIELEGHEVDGKPIPYGALIPPGKSVFDEFTQSLPDVLQDASMLLLSLRTLSDRVGGLFDADNSKLIRQTLANAERATRTLADGLQPLLVETRAAVADLGPVLQTTEASLATVGRVAGSRKLTEALASVTTAMARVDRIESEVLRLVADLSGMVGSTRHGWFGTLGTARRALDEIRMLARNLRLAPSSLVFGRGDQEIVVPATPDGGKR